MCTPLLPLLIRMQRRIRPPCLEQTRRRVVRVWRLQSMESFYQHHLSNKFVSTFVMHTPSYCEKTWETCLYDYFGEAVPELTQRKRDMIIGQIKYCCNGIPALEVPKCLFCRFWRYYNIKLYNEGTGVDAVQLANAKGVRSRGPASYDVSVEQCSESGDSEGSTIVSNTGSPVVDVIPGSKRYSLRGERRYQSIPEERESLVNGTMDENSIGGYSS